ncbi:MAG: pilus assembly protein [Boseongicola sp.]|nr:pilus assembly protein [Boseongicola sp.]MDD9978557.1 pilus assembly protein [Boseongicola sp.]
MWGTLISRFALATRRFGRDTRGASLVEFGIVLPFMLLMLALMIEAGRFMWSYQVAVEGVRDAGRYLARIAPVDICQTGGTVSGYSPTLLGMVRNNNSGSTLFPQYVTVNSVTASHTCVSGTYRISPTPVGTVTANMTIQFPFAGITSIFGDSMTTLTATISDQSRIFGQ